MTTMTTYYKVLASDGSACCGGQGKWSLPQGNRPGEWMPKIEGDIIPCERGYHLCQREDLIRWLGEAIFEAEVRGPVVVHYNKVVVAEARLVRRIDAWNKRTARLFAADCAEMVLPIFEHEYPSDDRPRKAIAAARAYANGGDYDHLMKAVAASRDAWDASFLANGAVGAAAMAAARIVTRVAHEAQDDIACDAIRAAVCVTCDAAYAAYEAMHNTAWWTAKSARDVMEAAGGDKGNAARYAAMEAMNRRLCQYLAGEEPKTPIQFNME